VTGKRATSPDLVTVTAIAPFQLAHAGTIAAPGELIEVAQSVADKWVLQGIGHIEKAEPTAEPEPTKPKPATRTRRTTSTT
jgi:hypothetical protein